MAPEKKQSNKGEKAKGKNSVVSKKSNCTYVLASATLQERIDNAERELFAKFDITNEAVLTTIFPTRVTLIDLFVQRHVERHREKKRLQEFLGTFKQNSLSNIEISV